MKNTFASKISYFILTFMFLIITASFLFSNFDNFSLGSSKDAASVDGTPITLREFQMALNRQVEFFSQMMGGKGMSEQQLEQMGIKQMVLNSLIQQKLMLNLGKQAGLDASLDEVKAEIKNMSYFKTNDQFDVNLYKNMLQANGYTPSQFEEMVQNDLKQKKIETALNSLIVSENYLQDMIRFKNQGLKVEGIKITRQALAPLVTVSEKEIKDYLADTTHKKNLEDYYNENLSRYNKPEEVKARHILISGATDESLKKITAIKSKLTVKNFSTVAKSETQDPSGKDNGGDLGWFSRGRMVPEFENVAFSIKEGQISEPVKTQFGYHVILVEGKKAEDKKELKQVEAEIAQLLIQKTKAQDLDQLLKSKNEELKGLLSKGDVSAVEAMAKKVEGQFLKETDVNKFDQTLAGQNLAPQESEKLFKAQTGEVIDLGNPGTIYLVKIKSINAGPDALKQAELLKTEGLTLSQTETRKQREELVKVLNNKAKIVTNQGL